MFDTFVLIKKAITCTHAVKDAFIHKELAQLVFSLWPESTNQ